ncbi:MAG: D-glycero-alpha-D-manno-heptose-1,7-bisphosphate 7-phosphatase [Promethearchaeota archaeon]
MKETKAIFLDRDGTLNEDIGYDFCPNNYKLLPGVIEGLKLLQETFNFFIITNQSGIGMNLCTLNTFFEFNSILISDLKKNGIKILKTYYCPHRAEEGCSCRKPKIKLFEDCIKEFGSIDREHSWIIGDHPSDIQFGINTGIHSIFLLTGHGSLHQPELKERGITPDFVAENFYEAALFIVRKI